MGTSSYEVSRKDERKIRMVGVKELDSAQIAKDLHKPILSNTRRGPYHGQLLRVNGRTSNAWHALGNIQDVGRSIHSNFPSRAASEYEL